MTNLSKSIKNFGQTRKSLSSFMVDPALLETELLGPSERPASDVLHLTILLILRNI